jgi:hypothetical protein
VKSPGTRWWEFERIPNLSLTEVLNIQTFFGTKPFAAILHLKLSLHAQSQILDCGSLDDIDFVVLLQTHVLQAVIDIETVRDIMLGICL